MTEATGIAAVRVMVPLRRPLATARGTWRSTDAWIMRLTDGDGRAGLGEATLGPGADPADQAVLDGLVRSLVADPGEAARVVPTMTRDPRSRSRHPAGSRPARRP